MTTGPSTTTAEPTTSTAAPSGAVDVQVLAINDFHGNVEAGTLSIDPTTGGSSGPVKEAAGGAAYLASHVAALEAASPNSIFVAAGDLVGASPLTSALFHVEALGLMGLDLSAAGNHEFDEGKAELRRLQEGGCHPVDRCQDGDEFAGSDYRYLTANVTDTDTDEPLFPPYEIRDLGGARLAFVGISLEATPTIVSPSGVAGLGFGDEADAVNALVPELKAEGVDGIVVLIHDGGAQTGPAPRGSTTAAASRVPSWGWPSASTLRWPRSSAATATPPSTASSPARPSPRPRRTGGC